MNRFSSLKRYSLRRILYGIGFSPSADWYFALILSVFVILIVCVSSVFVFYFVSRDTTYDAPAPTSVTTIDTDALRAIGERFEKRRMSGSPDSSIFIDPSL